jgi:hypothetical protein
MINGDVRAGEERLTGSPGRLTQRSGRSSDTPRSAPCVTGGLALSALSAALCSLREICVPL